MDAKIITGLLLCVYLMTCISLSQSASDEFNTRLRFRRQDEGGLTCPEGTKPCKDDNKKCVTYCNGNPECNDASDELDCATTAIAATENENDRANAPQATTDFADATLPQISIFDQQTNPSVATGATTNVAELNAPTVILADGTTILLPDGTTATVAADATVIETIEANTAGVTETVEQNAATGATETIEPNAATGATETIEPNAATGATETIEPNAATDATDDGTTIETGTGATADTSATDEANTNGGTTLDLTTVDSNITVSNNDTAAESASWGTTIDAEEFDGNVTRGNDTEEATVPSGTGGRVELRVVVSPDVIQVQRGRTVELTCTVYGGDQNTNIYWIQDEPERRYALTDPAGENDKQVTASQVILRSRITLDDASKIGKYTCMAQDAAQNTGSASVTMQEGGSGGYYPGGVGPGPAPNSGGRGFLRIIAPIMTEGDYVEITCEGAAPEDEGRIQWYFNNKPVADVQPLFPRGKTLHIRPISRPYLGNYRCTIPGSDYTDANSVLTFAGTSGGSVGPAQPTGSCNVDEATCRNGRCIPRAYLCDGKNDCGDNSDEACSQPGGSGTDVCQPNEIRCSDGSRGRKCVQKFWMCDGDRDCDDGSDEQQHWCELLPRQRFCKPSEFQCVSANGTYGNPVCVPRSFQCDGYNDCPDRSDEIGCTKPTVISPPQRQIQINAGETLTIQCTARGSPAPYINWRLNWGNICGDGSDNGRCTMAQSLDPSDPNLVTGTLTVRNVNGNDGGAYSCEALNNQGFIFAIPDAIVNVIIDGRVPQNQPCNCNGHSTTCSPDGRCLNCLHNTAGYNCEHCAPGFQGDARRGTPQDCQYAPVAVTGNCEPSGTHMERNGRCICKYNVEGDRCDRCKHNHFYLNPTAPNGCLACFCSGVSSDCRSTDWRRQAVPLSLENWNAVPKNFANDRYEAGNQIQRRQNGRELALDQNSLGRPANDVLYWKAPKEVLGDVVTLYDGNIDIHFTNDGNDKDAPSNDEFIWLRGNNIDLVHKLPQTQRFKANTNATYSVPCNERTFTRKDGTHIDRENILMALSDLDTFLVKINPIGGRRNAVLRGVTLNVAARDGYADAAPTVESCSCPANYTGTSCEKCAEGYGRPHPLVGIYLGQCWSCRSLCHERSDQCDRETGKCSGCQGNSEGDRCERCRAGFVLDPRANQCVPEGQYVPYPSQPDGTGSRGSYVIGQRPHDGQSSTPLRIVLDSNQPEQRIPLQILNIQPQSVIWSRAGGHSLPSGVSQENNDLVIRNPSNEQAGDYVCTITHPDGTVERLPVVLDYPGHGQHDGRPQPPIGGLPHISIQPKVINLKEGQRMIVQYTVGSHEPIEVVWNKLTDQGYQPIPSLFTVEPNRLVLQRATLDAAGVYQVIVRNSHGEDRQDLRINVEPRRRNRGPHVRFPQSQYEIGQGEVIDIVPNISGANGATITWSKDGSTNLPHGVTARDDGYLRIEGHSQDVAGQYSLDVTNARGRISSPLVVSWKGASSQQGGHDDGSHDHQRSYIQVYFQSRDEQSHHVGRDIHLQCAVHGSVERPYEYTFTKDGQQLGNNVEVHPDGLLIIRNAQAHDAGRYRCEVTFPRAPEAGRQESSYDLRLDGASAGGYEQNYHQGGDQGQYGGDHGQQSGYVEVTVEPTEVTLARGQRATITCRVKGADQYKVTWGQYSHDTSLPSFARQEGNDVIITPTADTADTQMYFQCQVDVPGQAQPHHAYAPVNIQGGEQLSKKKKKRRT